MMANLRRESGIEAITFRRGSEALPRPVLLFGQAGGQLADASLVEDFALRGRGMRVTIKLQRPVCVALSPFFLGAEAFVYAFGGVEVDFELIVEVGVVWSAVLKLFVSVDGGHEINSEREI